jgi:hypothetical protein
VKVDHLRALSLADDIRSAYPGRTLGDAHVMRWAKELEEMSEREAKQVVENVTKRSIDPPSRAALLQALAEIRGKTMSNDFDWRLCVFMDGVECRNCGEVHGHLLPREQILHGVFHLRKHLAGEPDHFEQAKWPEKCDCDFVAPDLPFEPKELGTLIFGGVE